AQQGNFAVGFSAGTLGAGVDAIYGVSDRLNLRANFRAFDRSADFEADGNGSELDYSGDLELSNLGFGIDYHPFDGGFRFSAGLQISGNEVTATATCNRAGGCSFGNGIIPQGSSATANFDLSGTHPYVGIGWGNPVSDGIPFGLFFDFGLMFQGTPEVSVVAQCDAAFQAQCDSDAEDEERELQEDAEDFEVYPIVNVGLRWRFK
ncbi:MAG: hypothetical protein OXT49_04370, partial [Gammaproteobacteria bacterium]|nr:hypothetical protein [Gammaproteobacteria bacterium]